MVTWPATAYCGCLLVSADLPFWYHVPNSVQTRVPRRGTAVCTLFGLRNTKYTKCAVSQSILGRFQWFKLIHAWNGMPYLILMHRSRIGSALVWQMHVYAGKRKCQYLSQYWADLNDLNWCMYRMKCSIWFWCLAAALNLCLTGE